MPKALYVVKSSLNTNTPTRTAVRGSNAPNKEVNVGPANFTAFTNVILEIAVARKCQSPNIEPSDYIGFPTDPLIIEKSSQQKEQGSQPHHITS